VCRNGGVITVLKQFLTKIKEFFMPNLVLKAFDRRNYREIFEIDTQNKFHFTVKIPEDCVLKRLVGGGDFAINNTFIIKAFDKFYRQIPYAIEDEDFTVEIPEDCVLGPVENTGSKKSAEITATVHALENGNKNKPDLGQVIIAFVDAKIQDALATHCSGACERTRAEVIKAEADLIWYCNNLTNNDTKSKNDPDDITTPKFKVGQKVTVWRQKARVLYVENFCYEDTGIRCNYYIVEYLPPFRSDVFKDNVISQWNIEDVLSAIANNQEGKDNACN